jgi:glycosyltransferase involved in cell wall biosynthesis
MKILLVSLFLPRKDASHAGGRFVYEELLHLSKKNEVYLATRHEDTEQSALAALRPLCRELYPCSYPAGGKRGFIANLAIVGNYLRFSLVADRLIRSGGFDLVIVEWVGAAILIRRHDTPMLLGAHDVMTKPAERSFRQASGLVRAFAWLVYRLTMGIERMIARRFDIVITKSEHDGSYLHSMLPGIRSLVVPHPAGLDMTDMPVERRQGTILFLASYKHRPVNVQAALWFYQKVFPLVRSRVTDAHFIIAGYGPPPELTALESDSGVSVTGYVDDLDRCYRESAVFVAPILTGGGVIAKVLDALASGTPTVSTTFGNEGILAVPGHDLLVADEPAEFAAAVVRLLLEREFSTEMGRNGQSFVKARFGRDAVMASLDGAIAAVAGNRL